MSTLAGEIVLELIRKSGVQDWNDGNIRAAIVAAANEIAQGLWIGEGEDMALPDYPRLVNRAPFTFRKDFANAAITLASLANGNGTTTGARQSARLDLGIGSLFSRSQRYRVMATFEIAATPSAGQTIDLYWSPSTESDPGVGNQGGASGNDSAYTGYNNNNLASLKHCIFIGSLVVTANATPTVQAGFVGTFTPPTRYGSLIVYNGSGAALHSTEASQAITFTPDDDVIEDT